MGKPDEPVVDPPHCYPGSFYSKVGRKTRPVEVPVKIMKAGRRPVPLSPVLRLILMRTKVSRCPKMPHSAFDSLPIIDLALANSPEEKPQCLEELRHALFNIIGFMYIKNTGIPDVHPTGMKLTERW